VFLLNFFKKNGRWNKPISLRPDFIAFVVSIAFENFIKNMSRKIFIISFASHNNNQTGQNHEKLSLALAIVIGACKQ